MMWKVALLLMLTLQVGAQESKNDKLDIKQLEKQYWSPKDNEFNVIQNRIYSKERRISFSLLGGKMVNDNYTQGTVTGVTGNYYFTENWGFELNYFTAQLTNSNTTQDFVDEFGTYPNHNRLMTTTGMAVSFIPFYGKMSFIGKQIFYYDMSISLGGGLTNYEQQMLLGGDKKITPHYDLTIGQHFFLTNHFAVRVDFKNQLSTQEKVRYRLSNTQTEADRSLGNKSQHDTLLLIGVTYYH